MQIVIDIDDMAYKFAQNTSFVEDESTMFKQTNADRKKTLLLFGILDAIKNGTPLPKGHGKLFSANDLLDRIGLEDNDENREENVGAIITLEDFDFITAIIDADKEESEI